MINPVALVAVHAVVGTVVVSLVLLAWREEHKILDVAIASTGAGLLYLVPRIGGELSLLAMLGLLYWRCNISVAALAASVAIARLLMVPALATFR